MADYFKVARDMGLAFCEVNHFCRHLYIIFFLSTASNSRPVTTNFSALGDQKA